MICLNFKKIKMIFICCFFFGDRFLGQRNFCTTCLAVNGPQSDMHRRVCDLCMEVLCGTHSGGGDNAAQLLRRGIPWVPAPRADRHSLRQRIPHRDIVEPCRRSISLCRIYSSSCFIAWLQTGLTDDGIAISPDPATDARTAVFAAGLMSLKTALCIDCAGWHMRIARGFSAVL